MEKENVIEFLTGDKEVCATFTNKKYINKITKLYEKNPEEFKYFIINTDGSICANFPLKWVKISLPRQISEEQKAKASERLKNARNNRTIKGE